jgi:hypothetical protein
MEQNASWKLQGVQLVKKCSIFYGTQIQEPSTSPYPQQD